MIFHNPGYLARTIDCLGSELANHPIGRSGLLLLPLILLGCQSCSITSYDERTSEFISPGIDLKPRKKEQTIRSQNGPGSCIALVRIDDHRLPLPEFASEELSGESTVQSSDGVRVRTRIGSEPSIEIDPVASQQHATIRAIVSGDLELSIMVPRPSRQTWSYWPPKVSEPETFLSASVPVDFTTKSTIEFACESHLADIQSNATSGYPSICVCSQFKLVSSLAERKFLEEIPTLEETVAESLSKIIHRELRPQLDRVNLEFEDWRSSIEDRHEVDLTLESSSTDSRGIFQLMVDRDETSSPPRMGKGGIAIVVHESLGTMQLNRKKLGKNRIPINELGDSLTGDLGGLMPGRDDSSSESDSSNLSDEELFFEFDQDPLMVAFRDGRVQLIFRSDRVFRETRQFDGIRIVSEYSVKVKQGNLVLTSTGSPTVENLDPERVPLRQQVLIGILQEIADRRADTLPESFTLTADRLKLQGRFASAISRRGWLGVQIVR